MPQLTPKPCVIEQVSRPDDEYTPTGIGWDVIAPCGFCFGYSGEHLYMANSPEEAAKWAEAIVPCPCGCANLT